MGARRHRPCCALLVWPIRGHCERALQSTENKVTVVACPHCGHREPCDRPPHPPTYNRSQLLNLDGRTVTWRDVLPPSSPWHSHPQNDFRSRVRGQRSEVKQLLKLFTHPPPLFSLRGIPELTENQPVPFYFYHRIFTSHDMPTLFPLFRTTLLQLVGNVQVSKHHATVFPSRVSCCMAVRHLCP